MPVPVYAKRHAEEILRNLKNAAPFHLTFAPCGSMTADERAALEKHLREHFHLWADTWVKPYAAAIANDSKNVE